MHLLLAANGAAAFDVVVAPFESGWWGDESGVHSKYHCPHVQWARASVPRADAKTPYWT